MKQHSPKEAVKLLANTLANFSVVGFGLGVFEQNTWGLITGCYALTFALILIWRVK